MGHEFNPQSELIHFDYLVGEQTQLLRTTTALKGDVLTRTARQQALIIFNTISYPQNIRSLVYKENKRADEVLGVWQVETGRVYAEGFGTPDQIFERTKLHFPELYNEHEAETALLGFRLLAKGEAEEVKYPMFHPDGTRYIVGLKRVGNEIVNVSVDVGKFDRDLTPIESGDVVRILHERHQENTAIVNRDQEFPLLVIKRSISSISTQEVQQTAVARSLISDVDSSKKHASVFTGTVATEAGDHGHQADVVGRSSRREALPAERDLHLASRRATYPPQREVQRTEQQPIFRQASQSDAQHAISRTIKSDEPGKDRSFLVAGRPNAVGRSAVDGGRSRNRRVGEQSTSGRRPESFLARVRQKLTGAQATLARERVPLPGQAEAPPRLRAPLPRKKMQQRPAQVLERVRERMAANFKNGRLVVKQVDEKLRRFRKNMALFTHVREVRLTRQTQRVIAYGKTEAEAADHQPKGVASRTGRMLESLVRAPRLALFQLKHKWHIRFKPQEKHLQVIRATYSRQEGGAVLIKGSLKVGERAGNVKRLLRESGKAVRKRLHFLLISIAHSRFRKSLTLPRPNLPRVLGKKESLVHAQTLPIRETRQRSPREEKGVRSRLKVAEVRGRVSGILKAYLLSFRDRLRPRLNSIKRQEQPKIRVQTVNPFTEKRITVEVRRKMLAKLLLGFFRFWTGEKRVTITSIKLAMNKTHQLREAKSAGVNAPPTRFFHPWQIFIRWLQSDSPLRYDRPAGLGFGQPKMRKFKRQKGGIIFQRKQDLRSGSVVVA